MAVIIVAGIVVGIQTDEYMMATYGTILERIDQVVLAIFIIEAAIKIIAEGSKPWLYFNNSWNIFDFSIVAFSLFEVIVQSGASFAAVLRLFRLARLMRIFRVMRVLRLVTAFQELQFLVETILKSVASISYVGILLFLLFYIYGTMGVFLFRANDPFHFGTLPEAMLTLFTMVTMEGWGDIMYTNIYGCANYGYDSMASLCTNSEPAPIEAVVYFISFVLLGTMIVMNLFIGVIMNSMEQVKAEQNLERRREIKVNAEDTIIDEIFVLSDKLEKATSDLNFIVHLVKKGNW
jgi:voltage-gated sodium channel